MQNLHIKRKDRFQDQVKSILLVKARMTMIGMLDHLHINSPMTALKINRIREIMSPTNYLKTIEKFLFRNLTKFM